MKKILFIIVPIFLAIAIFAVIFIFINQDSGKGALQVTSNPISKVYADGKLIGQTPLCRCQADEMLSAGVHTIRMVPIQGNLEPFEEKITITPSVLTVVDRTFGPGASSQGSVISLSPISNKKDAQLLIVSFPDSSQVSLDSNPSGSTPLLLDNITASDHEIKVTKDGYQSKTLRVKAIQGYKLEALVFLGVNLNAATSSALPVASPSATPAPTSTAQIQVTILSTPTGFLRVRSGPSLGDSQIGTVNPGEKYTYIDEKNGWYEIKLNNGQPGWISSQYAQKSS